MAPGQKLYPRGTVKKIVKAHSGCSVSKNADVMVHRASLSDAFCSSVLTSCFPQIFLDYMLFMET